MKKNKVNTLYLFTIVIVPIVYVVYNFYLTYKIGNGDFSGIYTNLQGMVYLFVYYSATLMCNYNAFKENKKTVLYVFLLIELLSVLVYILNIYIEFNLLALCDVIVLTIPFITGMLQSMKIK